jgi:hypothetical protein
MGKRSRKQRPDGATSTRAERDARRAAAAAAPRRATKEAPPAPWGSFPLTELVVLLALIFGVVGFIRFNTHSGKVMVVGAMCLGSLGGLEVSIREHFAGFRSHSALLAGAVALVVVVPLAFLTRLPQEALLAVGVIAYTLGFALLRRAFKVRAGGVSFRV